MRGRIVLLARAPRAGIVKTRLARVLGDRPALALYGAFLLDQLAFLGSFAGDHDCEWCVDVAPDETLVDLARSERVALSTQVEGDLGARLRDVFARAAARSAGPTVVVGADSPTLPARLVRDALDRLGRHREAVVVPAEDGGYVLLGMTGLVPELFEDVPWGGDRVLELTRERARRARVVLTELEPWYDVDDDVGLTRLKRDLAHAEHARRAPRSLRSILDLAADAVV